MTAGPEQRPRKGADARGDPAPLVWLLLDDRPGHTTQAVGLAEALGWPYEIKDVDYRRVASTLSLFRLRTRQGIYRAGSAKLKPPWPDLVVSAGMRNEPVCRWIREQSGGRTRLVHIGRPWVPLEELDLVITTPQYRLADRPNVLVTSLFYLLFSVYTLSCCRHFITLTQHFCRNTLLVFSVGRNFLVIAVPFSIVES